MYNKTLKIYNSLLINHLQSRISNHLKFYLMSKLMMNQNKIILIAFLSSFVFLSPANVLLVASLKAILLAICINSSYISPAKETALLKQNLIVTMVQGRKNQHLSISWCSRWGLREPSTMTVKKHQKKQDYGQGVLRYRFNKFLKNEQNINNINQIRQINLQI